jgi:hypothetical protein
LITGAGHIVVLPHALGIAASETSGGFFTLTVLVATVFVQEPTITSLIVYTPGLLKVNAGLIEFALVPLAKFQEEAVPQKPAA